MVDADKLVRLLEVARTIVMTNEDVEAQARSFAYGNIHIHNPAITREDIDRAADALGRSDGCP
jgi:hypothetical protein